MNRKGVNGERSDKTTHRKKRRHHLVYPGARLAHPSLPTASPTRQEQPAWRATYWIGLDPTQQWLICSTYMSQMVGFQCSWCRKSTQEYWSFLLSAWSPQELNIRTNLEGERWSRRNPILGWRKAQCGGFSQITRKNWLSHLASDTTKFLSPDYWRSGPVGGRWLAQGVADRLRFPAESQFRQIASSSFCFRAHRVMIWYQTHTWGAGQPQGLLFCWNVPLSLSAWRQWGSPWWQVGHFSFS